MLLSCQNLNKSFAGDPLLENVSFHLEDHEKCALVGINGSGKSTILKMITGELPADSGVITISKNTSVGYLAQYQQIDSTETIYGYLKEAKASILSVERELQDIGDKMKSASGEELDQLMRVYSELTHRFEMENGFAAESQISGVFRGLGFDDDDKDRLLSELSGGQKTRVALARILLEEPDLLLLDEPTNHLDLDSVHWLETYLNSCKSALLLVSHDRYFLNQIVSRVVSLEHGTAMVFQGNYDAFQEKQSALRKAQYRAYLNQQQELRRQEAVIEKLKRFNREKSIKRAESREKMLQKTEFLEKPADEAADMHLAFQPRKESGKDVLQIEHLSKSFPQLNLFRDQNIEIKRGERVAVIGGNGAGKSTLLKIITGTIKPDGGQIRFGSQVQVGYYDQEQQLLDDGNTVFEEISDAYPDLNNTRIRSTLAAFLFTGDEVNKKIGMLSGGERGRVSLAKLMLSHANFLILDEPTNHLDIVSKGILEDALNAYSGTVLYVSHDRYFINRTATRILELTHERFISYIGNYDYYLEKKDELTRVALETAGTVPEPADCCSSQNPENGAAGAIESGAASWKQQKEQQAVLRRQKNRLQKVETEIADLESRSREIDAEFSLPETGTDLPKCQALAKEQKEIDERLETLYEEWETLSEELS